MLNSFQLIFFDGKINLSSILVYFQSVSIVNKWGNEGESLLFYILIRFCEITLTDDNKYCEHSC